MNATRNLTIRAVLGALVLACPALALPASALAAVKTFDGSVDNAWNNPSNWTTDGNPFVGGVPTAADDVEIPGTKVARLNTGGIGVARSVTVHGQLQVIDGPVLRVGAGPSVIAGDPSELKATLMVGGGSVVELGPQTTWRSGAISVGISSGPGTILIGAGEVLDITGTATSSNGLCCVAPEANRWHNEGTVNRTTSSGTARIRAPFENDGVVNVESGTLGLEGGDGTNRESAGDFVAAAGATLALGSSHQIKGATASVSGAGTIRQDVGRTEIADGATFDVGALQLNGVAGTLQLDSDGSTGTLTGTGARSGIGTLRVEDATTVLGAAVLRLLGSGTTTLDGTATIDGSAGTGLAINGGHTLNLPPTTTWSSGGINVGSAGPGTVNIGPGDVLDVTGDVTSSNGGEGAWNNAGTVNRTTSAGTAQFVPPFTNTGRINVDSGTLKFLSGLTQTAGATDVDATTTLGGDIALHGGTLQGAGIASGSVDNSGGTVAPGASPGTLTIGGNYTQGELGTLHAEIAGTAPGTGHDQLLVAGTATLAGTLTIVTDPGFTPAIDDAFTVVTAGSREGEFTNLTGSQLPGRAYDDEYTTTQALLKVVVADSVHDGDLVVTDCDDPFLADVTEITGDLIIQGLDCDAAIALPNLTRVGGDLTVVEVVAQDVHLDTVTTVGGDMIVVEVVAQNVHLNTVTTVGGDMIVVDNDSETNVPLENLESVGCDLTLETTSTLELGDLEFVGCDMTVTADEADRVTAVTANGTTDVSFNGGTAQMRVVLPEGTFDRPVRFKIEHQGNEPAQAGMTHDGAPAEIEPIGGYRLSFEVPDLNRDATLEFTIDLSQLDDATRQAVLKGAQDGGATLAVRGDEEGASYRAFRRCGAGETPAGHDCVRAAMLDADGNPVSDPAEAAFVRFDGVAGHFSTWAVALVVPHDTTPPVVTCVEPVPVFLLAQQPAEVTAAVSDDGSGPEAESVTAPADTSLVGEKRVSLVARDLAGNVTTIECSYRVEYRFEGFLDPVENPPGINTINAGRAVPLRWRLTNAAGSPVTDLAEAEITAITLECDLGTTPDLPSEQTAGRSGLQNLGDGYYQLNWDTPRTYADSCKTLRLDLDEGAYRTALFRFRRNLSIRSR